VSKLRGAFLALQDGFVHHFVTRNRNPFNKELMLVRLWRLFELPTKLALPVLLLHLYCLLNRPFFLASETSQGRTLYAEMAFCHGQLFCVFNRIPGLSVIECADGRADPGSHENLRVIIV
jgi:hypothetical protein